MRAAWCRAVTDIDGVFQTRDVDMTETEPARRSTASLIYALHLPPINSRYLRRLRDTTAQATLNANRQAAALKYFEHSLCSIHWNFALRNARCTYGRGACLKAETVPT